MTTYLLARTAANEIDNNESFGFYGAPGIAALNDADGGYAVAWSGRNGVTAFSIGVFVELLDKDGNRIGGTQVEPIGKFDQDGARAPQIIGLPAGQFAVAFEDMQGGYSIPNRDPGLVNDWSARLGIGDDLLLQQLPGARPTTRNGDLTLLHDGQVAFAWTSTDGRLFAGLNASAPALASSLPGDARASLAPVGTAGSDYVVVWATPSGSGDVSAAIVHDGVAGTPLTVNTTTQGVQTIADSNHAVANLTNGDFVVVWQTDLPNFDLGVRAQRFTATGTKLGSEIVVNAPTDDNGNQLDGANPEVAALPNGGFVVTWDGEGFGPGGSQAQMFDAAGNKVGPQTRLGEGANNPSVSVTPDGKTVGFAWSTNVDVTGGSIQAQVFDIVDVPGPIAVQAAGAGGKLYGTNIDDQLKGGPWIEEVFGYCGAFILSVNDGYDSLDGGSGIDKAAFRSNAGFYDYEKLDDTFWQVTDLVADRDGSDRLARIEILQFADMDVDLTGGDAGAKLLFGTAGDDTFTVDPDAPATVFVGQEGINTVDLSALFAAFDEAQKAIARLDFNQLFVTIPDTSSRAFGLSQIQNVFGTSGKDVIVGDGAPNFLKGLAEADLQFGGNFAPDGSFLPGSGADTLEGGDGNDGLWGADGDDVLTGGAGTDGLVGGPGNDSIDGGDGADFLFGGDFSVVDGSFVPGSGDDTLKGGLGDDGLWGFDGNDRIFGDSGNDYGAGGLGDDSIDGGADNDNLVGDEGHDTLDGGDGDDGLYGSAGDDVLNGGLRNDYIDGGADNDKIFGNEDADTLVGQGGDDTINGGSGFDYIFGGAGKDTFVFRVGDGYDYVWDFSRSDGDRLELDGFGITSFAQLELTGLTSFHDDIEGVDYLVLTLNNGLDQLTMKGIGTSLAEKLYLQNNIVFG